MNTDTPGAWYSPGMMPPTPAHSSRQLPKWSLVAGWIVLILLLAVGVFTSFALAMTIYAGSAGCYPGDSSALCSRDSQGAIVFLGALLAPFLALVCVVVAVVLQIRRPRQALPLLVLALGPALQVPISLLIWSIAF